MKPQDFDPEMNMVHQVEPFRENEVIRELDVLLPFSASALKAAQDKVMQIQVGCPSPLRIGPRDRHAAFGSGLLVTNGRDYGILTAGHVAHDLIRDESRLKKAWGVLVPPPRGPRTLTTVPGDVKVDLTNATPGIGLRVNGGMARLRDDSFDRTDIGMVHLDTRLGDEACNELGLRPLWLDDSSRMLKQNALAGVHVAVGTPMSCQETGRDGQPVVIAHETVPCRVYRSGSFDHIGYGAHLKHDRGELDWRGFSGSPVWAVEPRADSVEKVTHSEEACSPDDFREPKLAGLLWAVNKKGPTSDSSVLRHFRLELYAHRVDAAFLQVAGQLLEDLSLIAREDRLQGRYMHGVIYHV